MAFDEQGQADTLRARPRFASAPTACWSMRSALRPRTSSSTPTSSPWPPALRSIANYAVDFIEAVRWISRTCPAPRSRAGVQREFSFRGNDPVREAIHTVFLYHAIAAGMDMGIVNAGMVGVYDDLEPELRERVEDVVLNRRPDAAERLLEIAESAKGAAATRARSWSGGTPEHPKTVGEFCRTRWCMASPTSSSKTPKTLPRHRRRQGGRPLHVIEGPLMDGMNIVGDPVRCGQDVSAAGGEIGARMKQAVAHVLIPTSRKKELAKRRRAWTAAAGKSSIATVRATCTTSARNIVTVVCSATTSRSSTWA